MTLPASFQFSQGSLQDYVDCPRRFQLRYVQQVAWPAVEAEPALEHEKHLQHGVDFHRLIHQHTLGISAEHLSKMVTDPILRRWWDDYLESQPDDLPATRYPEIVLSTPLGGHRLLAKIDLIAAEPGKRTVILDWKTSKNRPPRRWLAQRLQTRVYPFLLIQAGSQINDGQALRPEQVEMVYWFATFPRDPERFSYDAAQYEADSVYLAALIDEIKGRREEEFHLTPHEQRCRYCPYRSLCQRGVGAGTLDQAEDEMEQDSDFDLDIDFEQIAEIEY